MFFLTDLPLIRFIKISSVKIPDGNPVGSDCHLEEALTTINGILVLQDYV